MIERQTLLKHLNALLDAERFKDYGPNGLQVEGKPQIQKIVTGVTASLALIEAAVEAKADAILVHHGLFWKGQDGRVTGWMKQRLALLLQHDINLFAYHLPLDAHIGLGNNAQWGLQLGLTASAFFGDQNLGFMGALPEPLSLSALQHKIEARMGRRTIVATGDSRPIRQVAWCSGGAQSYFEAAIAQGADVFLTGEISEPQAHYARETGVAFIACGHHASERYGVQAVGDHLSHELALTHQFIDIDNPA